MDGTVRTFRVYRPSTADAQPVPLVLVFHGYGGNAAMSESWFGWNDVADREGFVVVYPDGIYRSFNAGACCGAAVSAGVDDVAAALAMVDDVIRSVAIDTDRMYVAGFSNGGAMTYRMACETDDFAAFGPVAGGQVVDCSARMPTSILHIHGATDAIVPLGGDEDGMGHPAIEATLTDWRSFQRCGPPTESASGVTRQSLAACEDGREVGLITVGGLGHTWPAAATGLDAAETLWQFFTRHPR